jgi:hypothetical protein
MKIWICAAMVAVILVRVDAAASDPAAPKRIDGGVTATTPESLISIVLECFPVKIVISFIVLEDGTTANFEVVEATPDGVDTSMAVELVSKFQYEPVVINGVVVQSATQIQHFTFDPASAPRCSVSAPT